MWRRVNVGAIRGLVAVGAILLFAAGAIAAEQMYWAPPTTYSDGTAMDAATKAKLKYNVYTLEANGKTTSPDSSGRYQLGNTTIGGAPEWPTGGGIDNVLRGYGQAGKTLRFVVTAGYVDANNKWIESTSSAELAYTVPFEQGKVPGPPTAPGMR